MDFSMGLNDGNGSRGRRRRRRAHTAVKEGSNPQPLPLTLRSRSAPPTVGSRNRNWQPDFLKDREQNTQPTHITPTGGLRRSDANHNEGIRLIGTDKHPGTESSTTSARPIPTEPQLPVEQTSHLTCERVSDGLLCSVSEGKTSSTENITYTCKQMDGQPLTCTSTAFSTVTCEQEGGLIFKCKTAEGNSFTCKPTEDDKFKCTQQQSDVTTTKGTTAGRTTSTMSTISTGGGYTNTVKPELINTTTTPDNEVTLGSSDGVNRSKLGGANQEALISLVGLLLIVAVVGVVAYLMRKRKFRQRRSVTESGTSGQTSDEVNASERHISVPEISGDVAALKITALAHQPAQNPVAEYSVFDSLNETFQTNKTKQCTLKSSGPHANGYTRVLSGPSQPKE